MRSDPNLRAPLGLKIAAIAGLLFLHLPILLIFVYAFTTEDRSYQWPPPGFTLQWFAVTWNRPDVWAGAGAFGAGGVGLDGPGAHPRHAVRGGNGRLPLLRPRDDFASGHPADRAAGHHHRHRAAIGLQPCRDPFSFWTIVVGHATFCVVVVYNNAVARFRRTSGSLIEASMDLGADGFQTFRYVILPNLGTALLAGGMLAFALSFDEVIVTTFTAGQQQTLPIWMLQELVRPRQRPVTNVVAMVVVIVTFLPILIAYYLTRDGDQIAGHGK
jgi:putative spermidine/putrescine transport system permease protein